jgi:hypothetical protein
MRILTWTWNQYNYDIKIFDGDKLIGRIPKFVDNSIATINGKKFFFDSLYRTFISDPMDSNKAYCKIEYFQNPPFKITSPSFEYSADLISFFPFKRKWFMSNKAMRMVELEIPGVFFIDRGLIKIYQEDNFELVIYSLFYFNTYSDSTT